MKLFNFYTSKQEPPKTHLDRVHLIVHPGDGLKESNISSHKILLESIAARAISINTSNEIAVVLLQMNEAQLKQARDPAYTGKERILGKVIEHIESAIPDNILVIPNAASVSFPCLHRAFNDIRTKCDKAGFALDNSTQLVSYGEMVTKCVPAAATYFATEFDLAQSPIIDVNCTDALIGGDSAQWKRGGFRLHYAQSLSGNRLKYIPIGEKLPDT